MEQQERLKYLFQKYLGKTYSAEEKEELLRYIAQSQYDKELNDVIDETWNGNFQLHEQDEEEADLIFRKIVNAGTTNTRPRVLGMWMWAAAAVMLLVVGSLWFVVSRKPDAGSQKTEVAKTNDVPAPSNSRAVITLADGSKVYLDSAGNGIVAQQNNVDVVRNANGEIVYDAKVREANADLQYNTLSNPRGSKVISLTLSDGTKVWLNSESSLKYPTQFVKNTREVEITGEAYFEVAHNASKPFHVRKGETDVTVLGTHFNVNAYDDEDALRVTLLEGSVQVSAKLPGLTFSAVKIKPGQQAVVNLQSPNHIITTSPNLDAVMAWKNGLFTLENAGIESVMRQMSRWYDIEVVYESKPTKIFRGSIPREMSAAKVLKALEETGGVHFKIEGKKVIVMK